MTRGEVRAAGHVAPITLSRTLGSGSVRPASAEGSSSSPISANVQIAWTRVWDRLVSMTVF